ncbi:MAG: hypothetical protein IIA88_00965, partial [Bacteroidetes bacterium]|nr:hypothetical protein [Bacteroidota bacterium]
MYQKELWVPDHVYFSQIMRRPQPIVNGINQPANDILMEVFNKDKLTQIGFLEKVVEGYDAISRTSPLAANRAAGLIRKSKESARIAKRIYGIERGLEPLVEGASHKGIPHYQQFVNMINSL